MRKILLTLATSAFVIGGSGCMAVSATDNSNGLKDRKQVVAVNNRVYLVDTKTGEAREIDLKDAKPVKSQSVTPTAASSD